MITFYDGASGRTRVTDYPLGTRAKYILFELRLVSMKTAKISRLKKTGPPYCTMIDTIESSESGIDWPSWPKFHLTNRFYSLHQANEIDFFLILNKTYI